MINSASKLSASVISLSLVARLAMASVQAPHPAPAPFLAAGIPAFLALGGGALVGRVMRRRKSRNERTASASEPGADPQA
jgi:hypothetical protein